ncbi:MAG: hypothetical protein M5T61_17305 [Acidimicrobiia bacterium]|nr:hypothetical protein [Acidimicrobiia bacterium]
MLADYGTTVENELEVFGLIARADDDPRGFSLLVMVIGLFETGMISTAGGLFEADAGHLSTDGMSSRLADGLRRGALARPDGDVDKKFLAIDWFAYADLPRGGGATALPDPRQVREGSGRRVGRPMASRRHIAVPAQRRRPRVPGSDLDLSTTATRSPRPGLLDGYHRAPNRALSVALGSRPLNQSARARSRLPPFASEGVTSRSELGKTAV